MTPLREIIAKVHHASAVICLLLFPASILVLDHVYGVLFVLATTLGMLLLVGNVRRLGPSNDDEKGFFISLTLLGVTSVVTSLITQTDYARADRFLVLFQVIPIYWLYSQYRAAQVFIWPGLMLGASIAFLAAIFQVFGPEALARAQGAVHVIIFGDISLAMGVMAFAALSGVIVVRRWFFLFPVIALLFGLTASALSLSRGGWVSLPALCGLLVWFYSRYYSLRRIATALMLILASLFALYSLPQSGVEVRIDDALRELTRYLQSDRVEHPARMTSTGQRLEMWRVAWDMFLDNPLLGEGWGKFREHAEAMVTAGLINPTASLYYHPHNQYLSVLAKGGLLSFFALSFMMVMPGIIFCRHLRHTAAVKSGAVNSGAYALTGLILLCAFAGFAMTEAIFERSRTMTFFAFYLAVLMAAVLNPMTQDKPSDPSTDLRQRPQ